MDFEKLAENLGLEEDEFLEMAELFLETSSADLDKLRLAIEAGNAQEIARAAHSIKGAAGNLGFMEIFETAKEIEKKTDGSALQDVAEYVQVLEKNLAEVAGHCTGR